jgi:hypothetical protein
LARADQERHEGTRLLPKMSGARPLILLALLGAACGAGGGAVHAALHDDLTSLRRSIGEEQRAGKLDSSRVRRIAEAVASREVYAGAGPAASGRVRSLRACAAPLYSALSARAERNDEAGAEATLILLAAGRLQANDLVRRYDSADSGAWRAVAARASTAPERFTARRRYFVDPDERVRRAALEAAIEAPASLDLEVLAESARLDPDPMSQSLAVRALGALGGVRALRLLSDAWERAAEDLRLSIVEAYGARRSFDAGGREQLLRIAEAGRGLPAVAAAGVLLRVDPNASGTAVTLLARAITESSSDEQRLAISTAPLSGPIPEALNKAATDADPEVRIAALERLLAVPAQRTRALAALRTEAKPPAAAPAAARDALARAGDGSVSPALKKELVSPDFLRRERAGSAFLALNDYASAASLLGDGEANVRVSIACKILSK